MTNQKCPVHGIPDCSPLLNGCSWKPTEAETTDGLYPGGKFEVKRLRPSSRGIDHTFCWYFVLDPKHDPHARFALKMYAEACHVEYPKLSEDIMERLAGFERGDS